MKPLPERVYIFWTSQARGRVGGADPGSKVSPSVGGWVCGSVYGGPGGQEIANGVMYHEEMSTFGFLMPIFIAFVDKTHHSRNRV